LVSVFVSEWDISVDVYGTHRFKLLLGSTDGTGDDKDDSEIIIRTKAFERGVLALPGTVFFPRGRKTGYVRVAFSLTEEADVDEAVKRLRDVVLDARGPGVLPDCAA
jgi:tryptophan aminotransferase